MIPILESSLLATIAWFDVFDYPLTAWEAYRWRIDPSRITADASYDQVLACLRALADEGRLGKRWSFFYLPGRDAIVDTRNTRYLLAYHKYRRARRIAAILRYIPWVGMISVCNSLGYSNAGVNSDIDFFIVTAPGRVWTVRGLALLFLRVFHLRPLLARFGASHEDRKDRIDLSFFVAEDALALSSLALRDTDRAHRSHYPDFTDPYLSYWIILQTPLWDAGGVYQGFWESNASLRARIPYATSYRTAPQRVISGNGHVLRFLSYIFGCLPERWWKKLQMGVLPQRLLIASHTREGVILDDTLLKFHDIDRRREYRQRWRTLLSNVLK